MTLPRLLVSTFLAGLAVFIWGALAHVLPPEPLTVLKEAAPVDTFLAAHAPNNGVYMDPRGVFLAVRFAPGRPDKSADMGTQLGVEFATNLVQALALALLLGRFAPTSILRYGLYGAAIGLIAWLSTEVSYWNWYGISWPLVSMGLLDAVPGSFLAGAIIGWQLRKAA